MGQQMSRHMALLPGCVAADIDREANVRSGVRVDERWDSKCRDIWHCSLGVSRMILIGKPNLESEREK